MIPVTVTFGIEKVPFSDCGFVSNVYMPVPAVNVPLFVIPPLKVTAELPELFQVAPLLIVTNPVNNLVPVGELITRLPLVPSPIVVVPVTVKLYPVAVNAVPFLIKRLLFITMLAPVVALDEPLNSKL